MRRKHLNIGRAESPTFPSLFFHPVFSPSLQPVSHVNSDGRIKSIPRKPFACRESAQRWRSHAPSYHNIGKQLKVYKLLVEKNKYTTKSGNSITRRSDGAAVSSAQAPPSIVMQPLLIKSSIAVRGHERAVHHRTRASLLARICRPEMPSPCFRGTPTLALQKKTDSMTYCVT